MDKIIGCVQHDCEQCKKKNVPLSDDEILGLLSWQLWREMPSEVKIALVRDIEQAHGIGEKE